MAEYRIKFPVNEENPLKELKVWDVVFIDGVIIGIRDATLIRIFDNNQKPLLDLQGAACLHTAPGVKKIASGYEKVCIGTTTSTRMDRFTEPLMRHYGAKAIIGKGGLLGSSVNAMKAMGGCYLAITGGAAALETTQIEEIMEVHWEDLMPECLWKFKVKDFGPLIVAIDCKGNNLYFDVKDNAKKSVKRAYGILGVSSK